MNDEFHPINFDDDLSAHSFPQKQKTGIPVKKLIIGILLLIILCCLLFAGFAYWGAKTATKEIAPIEAVLDSFMKAAASQDVDAAYALFSPRARRQMSRDDVAKSIEGNNFALFDGYKKVKINNINISNAINTNPDVPQGLVANVSGQIEYEGGITGQISAVLENVDGQWMIHFVNVTAPPEKFK